tara:strand:- start:11861 stop:13435 length:1575 start_codon:yes stop_codon:yes gene_type:complete
MTKKMDPVLEEALIRASPEINQYLQASKGKSALEKFSDFFRLAPDTRPEELRQVRASSDRARANRDALIQSKEELERKYYGEFVALQQAAQEGDREARKALMSKTPDLIKHIVEVMKSSNQVRGQNATALANLVGKMHEADNEWAAATDINHASSDTQLRFADAWTAMTQFTDAEGNLNIADIGSQQQVLNQLTELFTEANARGDHSNVLGALNENLKRRGVSGGVRGLYDALNAGSVSNPDGMTYVGSTPEITNFNRALEPSLNLEAAALDVRQQAKDEYSKFSTKLSKSLGGQGAGALLKYIDKVSAQGHASLVEYDEYMKKREAERGVTPGTEDLLSRVSEDARKRLPHNFDKLDPTQQELLIRAGEQWQMAEALKNTPIYDTRKQAAYASIQNHPAFMEWFEQSNFTDLNKGTEHFIGLQQQNMERLENQYGGEAGYQAEVKERRGIAGDPRTVTGPKKARMQALRQRLPSLPAEEPESSPAASVGGAVLPTDKGGEEKTKTVSPVTQHYMKQLQPSKSV